MHEQAPDLKKLLRDPKTRGSECTSNYYYKRVWPAFKAESEPLPTHLTTTRKVHHGFMAIRAYHATKLCREWLETPPGAVKPFNYLQHDGFRSTFLLYWNKRQPRRN